MPRDYRVRLDDILDAAEEIREFPADMTQAQFRNDRRTVQAVARNLEIIGEAAKHVPDDIRAQHPEIAWRRIAGLRDMLIHQYFGLDVDIVWDIARNKIPLVAEQVRRILEE